MLNRHLTTLTWGAIFLLATGCTFTQIPQATPTIVPITVTDAPTVTARPSTTPTAADTPEPLATSTAQALVEPTDTPLPPSATPTATDTPGPFLHEIQSGETLGFIVQQYGHRSFDVIDVVVEVIESIFNPDTLPPPGTIILIPRPTAEIVAEAISDGTEGNNEVATQFPRPGDGFTLVHLVQEGESLIDISQQYSTTLEIIAQLNPDIGFFGCNFNNPSGGPECIIQISIGQEVIVPAPTPTPTLSPTPSGNETATPTPTYMPPLVVFPPDNGIARAGVFRLQWVGAGVLRQDEVYLVYIKNVTTDGQVNAFITRDNTFQIPVELAPNTAERQEYEWWVTIGRLNESGQYANVSGEAEVNTFFWQGAS
jgi:hypothetical protein